MSAAQGGREGCVSRQQVGGNGQQLRQGRLGTGREEGAVPPMHMCWHAAQTVRLAPGFQEGNKASGCLLRADRACSGCWRSQAEEEGAAACVRPGH